jgi:hypothetical protein
VRPVSEFTKVAGAMCTRRMLHLYQLRQRLDVDPASLLNRIDWIGINAKRPPTQKVLKGLAKKLDVDLRYLEELVRELSDGRPSRSQRKKGDRVDSFKEFQKANPDAECVCRHPASMHTPGSWCTQQNCGCTRFMTPGETEEFLLYCFGPPGRQAMPPGWRGRRLSRQRPH